MSNLVLNVGGGDPSVRAVNNGKITKVVINTTSTKKLSGVITANNIPSLEEITVKDSGITQFIGTANLKKISLADNNIPDFSAILPSISYFNSLTQFVLSGNNVTLGNIPSFINNTQLKILELNSNNLTGDIPVLSNNPLLQVANFSQNNLTGNIPDLDGCPDLKVADFSENNLTGIIPSITNNNILEYFAVSTQFSNNGNSFTGALPVVSSRRLRYFAITKHQLTGEVHDFHDTPLLEKYLHTFTPSLIIGSFTTI